MLRFVDCLYGSLSSRVEYLERLAADLRALAEGQLPSPERLAASPQLNPYSVTTVEVPVLAGLVDRHPILGASKTIVTSPVWAVAKDRTWARTYSRYYRLGRSMADDIIIN